MSIVFIIAAVIVVISVNYSMRRQALIEAQTKARIILDRNFATHTYFSQIMKPSISAWSEPFRRKEYFDPTWMSSTYAIREIEKYFKSFSPSDYYFKDAALNARNPENEADEYERAFLEKLNADKKLESESTVRKIDGEPYLIVLRKGEVMETSCLRCHDNPKDAPKGLTDYYGSERSFNRKTGDAVSAVSLRIPLAEAYEAANNYSLKLSAILLIVIVCLFTIQYWFYRRYLLKPLNIIREKAVQIATHDENLGEQISRPFGRELNELATAFNEMSIKLRRDRDDLKNLIDKRTEALLREKEFAENLIQTAQTIVLVLDTTGRIVSFNHYMEEISGYSLKEVQGKDWFSTFIPERDRNRIRELFLSAIDDIQTRGNINPIVTKNGREVYIEWYDKTLKDENDNALGLISIGQDITERKQAEEALQKAKEMLVQSEKLAALGKLSAGASHEILNPLNILSMRLQFLEMTENLSEKTKEAVKIAKAQIDRIVKITQSISEFSRTTALHMSTVDLRELMEDVFLPTAPRLKEENIKLDVQYQAGLPSLWLDKFRIEQVILNLVNNAVDAMKGRKVKRLRVTAALDDSEGGHSVRITFSDAGTGIKAEDMNRIFDPFFTTKAPDKGKGLGLSVCYGIVQDHGGRIWAENNDEGGATFVIELPVKETNAA